MEEQPEESLEPTSDGVPEACSNSENPESLEASAVNEKSSVPEDNDLDTEPLQELENDVTECTDDEVAVDKVCTEMVASGDANASAPELAENEHNECDGGEDEITSTASNNLPVSSGVSATDDLDDDSDNGNSDVDKSAFDAENADIETPAVEAEHADSDESSPDETSEQEAPDDGCTSDTIESKSPTEEKTDVVRAGEIIASLAQLNSTDESDFFGFDSATIKTSVEKTSGLIQTLQDKESVLSHTSERNDVTMAVPLPEENLEEVAPSMIPDYGQSNHADAQFDQSQSDTTTPQAQIKQPRKPPSYVHTVYGMPVNVFEETLPSGSKRVKKKRKFFGDFDEPDGEKASRKSSISRPNDDDAKLLNISGENKENFITEEKTKTESVPENDTANQNKSKRAHSFDISNPLFKEPFKYGWKREICYRHLPEGSKSKPAYVSYFSPQGKKFKTIRQIVEILPPDSDLGTQHFTFSVQRIFNEPSEFEILKDAKARTDLNDTDGVENESMEASPANHLTTHVTPHEHVKFLSKKKLPTPGTPAPRLFIKKPKYLKQADSEDDGPDMALLLPSTPSSTTPKIVIKGPSLNSAKVNSSKPKSNSVKKDKKPVSKKSEKNLKKSFVPTESIHNSTREYANSFDTSTPAISKNTGDRRTCSFSCPLALGSVPTLQCTVCLGLYHFKCCGIDASQPVHGYVCKSCRSRAEVQSKLLLAVSESSSSNTLGYGGSNALMAGSRPVPKNAKIVDGVTTWLPPSSNVQLSSRLTATSPATLGTPETTQQTLLQSVLELDGRRFIIVPKESIVSISPNTSSTVNTYSGSFVERQNDAAQQLSISPTVRATLSSMRAETALNYVNNSPDTNSAGVLLVPVIPSGNDPYCNEVLRGKRKLSDDTSDEPTTKVPKLQDERVSYKYRSALTLSNVARLYNPLTSCFKYLTVRDLLRVSMSCKYLNSIASEPSLWTTVRLKNSKVRDWEGFARTLRKHGTKKLDLRKMLCPSAPDDVSAMWNTFLEKITAVTSLEHIEFSRCNAQVVETVARTCPNLVVINAVQLRNGDNLSIETFVKLKNLRELRLKGLNGLNIEMSAEKLEFESKETMRVLSLTSIKNVNSAMVQAIGALSGLHSLELGECNGDIVDELAVSIGKLSNLRRLRLEQITNLDPHFKLFESLKSLPQLKSLELINVEVRMGFCEAIATCTNIENLVIFPFYKTESATSNRLLMDSLLSLSKSLKSFVWGLTHELIRATDLYANKYFEKPNSGNEESKTPPKKGQESIPILKRINKLAEVEILPVRNLEKMLMNVLPQSRVKVVTVANAVTWRQN